MHPMVRHSSWIVPASKLSPSELCAHFELLKLMNHLAVSNAPLRNFQVGPGQTCQMHQRIVGSPQQVAAIKAGWGTHLNTLGC